MKSNPPSPYSGIRTAAIERLARVADAIGTELREQVVFIGGSILPLLQTDNEVFGSPRSTKDVDGVVATQRYTDRGGIEDKLRQLSFKNDTTRGAHVDRWKAPDGNIFDLVS